MASNNRAALEDIEFCRNEARTLHPIRVEKRFLASLLRWAENGYKIIFIMLALINILLPPTTIWLVYQYVQVSSRCSQLMVSEVARKSADSALQHVKDLNDNNANINCKYSDCEVDKLNFNNLKSFAKCSQCFTNLTVNSVFVGYHGEGYGIYFNVHYIQDILKFADSLNFNKWEGFSNIRSNLKGEFALQYFGDNSQLVLMWSNLKITNKHIDYYNRRIWFG